MAQRASVRFAGCTFADTIGFLLTRHVTMSESLPQPQDSSLAGRLQSHDAPRCPTPLPERLQIRELAATHHIQVQDAVTKGRISGQITLEHMDALKDLADTLDPDDANAFLNMYTEERTATAYLLQEAARLKAKAQQRERMMHISIAVVVAAAIIISLLYWS